MARSARRRGCSPWEPTRGRWPVRPVQQWYGKGKLRKLGLKPKILASAIFCG